MDHILRKYMFLARLANQPLQYSYQIVERCAHRIRNKYGASLSRYLSHHSKNNPLILEEWISSKADMKYLKDDIQNARIQLDLVYQKLYKRQMPIDYALGWTPFMGLKFQVERPVLIPRSDTAIWVSELIDILKPIEGRLRVLEVGAGTGCIAISMARALPKLEFTVIDISKAAIRLAKTNAERHLGQKAHMEIIHCDVFKDDLLDSLGLFDLIICNPPYISTSQRAIKISPSVRIWESPKALIGGTHPLGASFHLRLLEIASFLSSKKAPISPRLALELNGTAKQMRFVRDYATKLGFSGTKVIYDHNNRPRALFCY